MPSGQRPIFNYQPTVIDFKKLFIRKEENSQYLLVDGVVIKMVVTAEHDEYNGKGSITCKITEKDGLVLPKTTIEETKTVMNVESGRCIQVEDQKMLLVGLLDAFGLKGRPIVVSESYVVGHIKHLRLLERVANKGAR